MECDFETIAPGVHRCRACEQVIRANVPAEEIRARCGRQRVVEREVSNFDCEHRGDVVRTETCKLCGDRTVIAEVHACDIYSECTIHAHGLRGNDGQLLRRCISCADITSRQT